MTSKVFYCSQKRAMHLAQEVLHEMKLRKEHVDNSTSRIQAKRGWNFLSPAREIEIQVFSEENRVEVAVNVESKMNALDFGTNIYLEEEILYRLKERMS